MAFSIALIILLGLGGDYLFWRLKLPGFVLLRLSPKYAWRPPKRIIVVLGVAIFLTWLERVRSKRHGTVWKVIEEKETWLPESADPQGEKPIPDLVPAVSLRYWKEDSSQGPGSGNNIGNISEKK